MPLLHLWSLSVEEQFYVVWPLLFMLLSDRRGLLFALIVVLITSFALSVWLVIWDQSAAFFLMPARAWELATGALLAFFVPISSGRGSNHRIGVACGLLGIAMIFASIFLFDRATPFPGASAALPVIGTALVIWGNAAASRSWVSTALSYRPIVFVGLISYSLYLWHWPLLALANAGTLGQPHPILITVLVTLAFVLSWLTYRFVELPFRRSSRILILGQWQTLRFAAAGSLVVLVFGGIYGFHAQDKAARWDHSSVSSRLGKWPEYADGCNLSTERLGGIPRSFDVALDHCIEEPDRDSILVLWGDSHAVQFLPLARDLASASDMALVPYTFNNCPPANGFFYPGQELQERNACLAFNDEVIAAIQQLTQVYREVSVIIAARWVQYLGEKPIAVSNQHLFFSLNPLQREQRSESLRVGFETSLSRLADQGVRALAILPVPEPRFAAPICLLRDRLNDCSISRIEFLQYRARSVKFLESMADQYSYMRLVDPIDFFCNETKCPLLVNGRMAYIDDNHISVEVSRAFGESILSDLRWLVDSSESLRRFSSF